MSVELQRIPSLRQEAERLQSVLETECRQRTEQQDQAAHLERLITAQQEEMELLSTKLGAAELEVSRAAGRERSLHTALEEVRREADHLRQDLSDRDGRNAAAQATIGALHTTIREMHDTSLALQEEKSRTSHELSSVKKQLHTLRRSTPAAADTPRSGPASLQNNGSIHDEIISTIQTTGAGDSELPLSGIASPELVQAIYASPPNLHFKTLPRRLQMSSTPQSHPSQQQEQDEERSPLDNPDESAELDERYSSAASDSYGSPEVWRSRPPSAADMAVQTEPGSGSEQRAPVEDGATQTEQELDQEDSAAQTEPPEQPAGRTAAGDRDTETATVPSQTTETGPAAGGRWLSESESESESRCVLMEEAATQTEYDPDGMSAEVEEDADSIRLWSVPGTFRRSCSDNTCAATYGADQVGGEGAALSAGERRWLRAALQQTDGLQPPLLHQLTDLFYQQEMLAGGSYSAAGPGVGMKRTHSDGALSAPLRTRFCSMPTVEEVPDDPDTDIPQHSPLRASFSLPCDPTEVGIFPSLTEHMLADLHYHADENANNTNEKDLESKFSSLALAFKTDRLTLHERLDVQRRHRDQAEQNLDLEAQRFREQLMMLTQSDADRSEQMKSLQRQLDIIKQISQRLSRTAEVLGAAQQELRVSRAVEVMTQHVESLRHLYEREHAELEEARRVLATNNIALHEPVQKTVPGGRRRASIAVFAPRPAGQPLGGLSGGPLTGHSVQTLSPSPSSPTLGAAGLRRRRNSLGAGDADVFGAIKEEKEDERMEPDQTHPSSEQQLQPAAALSSSSASSGEQQQQQDHQHHQQQEQPADVEDLRTHVEETVSDELATLRSEQEQLANDLKTLLSRQRDAVLQQTTTVGKLLWDVAQAWPYSREQTVARARYCVGGLFLLLAIMVLLVPPAYTSCNTQPHAFYSWAELLSPHLSLRHVHRPPL